MGNAKTSPLWGIPKATAGPRLGGQAFTLQDDIALWWRSIARRGVEVGLVIGHHRCERFRFGLAPTHRDEAAMNGAQTLVFIYARRHAFGRGDGLRWLPFIAMKLR